MTDHKCSTSWCDERVPTAGETCERCQHERAKFERDQRAKWRYIQKIRAAGEATK